MDEDINAADSDGRTPLMRAAEQGNEAGVRALLDAGADVHAQDQDGLTALMYGARAAKPEIVRLLLGHGADACAETGTGFMPVMCAAVGGNLQVLELLRADGADPLAVSKKFKRTSLMYAAMNGHAAMCRRLLELGANPDARDAMNETALDFARKRAQREAETVLAGRAGFAVSMPRLAEAVKEGREDEVRALLEHGFNPDSPDQEGELPLHWAVNRGNLTLIRLLLDHGWNVNAPNRDGWTALMIAGSTGHLDAARLLLERGADARAMTGNNFTTAMAAAQGGSIALLDLMLANGADLHATIAGSTALFFAVRTGHVTMARRLLEVGLDPTARNEGGISPLDNARNREDHEMMSLLEAWADNARQGQ